MRANLPEQEPEWLNRWYGKEIYQKMVQKNKGKPLFILHDGPPYANGTIHSGTVLNKILKDIVVKHRSMSGFDAEFIPGWDCHGLPIENNIERELKGGGKNISVQEFRQLCRDFALKFVSIQREEFKRLGVLADWANPYLTLKYKYEATIAREFGKLMRSGALYRGKKPVYWCAKHNTALAEAEIEYAEHKAPSIWVKFEMAEDARARLPILPKGKPAYFVIWTTTPWTLPANLGITLHPAFDYTLLDVGDEVYLVAEDLAEQFVKDVGIQVRGALGSVRGAELDKTHAKHPFVDRESLIMNGMFVTLEAGTGCVHTAPGHGAEDYEVGLQYGLPAYAPVDQNGCFTEEVPEYVGRYVFDTDKDICEMLDARGALLGRRVLSHAYPNCERCHQPVIFRATDQWFVSMDSTGIRDMAIKEIERVEWVPPRGQERIRSMVQARPDWCISRQRRWGVPIVVFFCETCGEPLMDPEVVFHVADIFEKEGADAWFIKSEAELIPHGTTCPHCNGKEFRKERDIIDVWFESGVSYAAVVEAKYGEGVIADLYLEGSDQHRGWFHSTLLESVATRKRAPYATVLTHGFVVDGEGKKISKSLGNFIPPKQIIEKHGAEIYRLWVAAENYQDDVRISEEILGMLKDAYRKIRNTFRFMLGNLQGFNPPLDMMALEELLPVDRWMLHLLNKTMTDINAAYERYDFGRIYQIINNFTTVELSAIYLDILKDRLYVLGQHDRSRRSGRTVLYHILRNLTIAMAPILSFTCEEVWQYLPKEQGDPESVFLTSFPAYREAWNEPGLDRDFEILKELRTQIQKDMESARANKVIGHPLEAMVSLKVGKDHPWAPVIERYADFFTEWLIISEAEVLTQDGAGMEILVEHASGGKCERCWHWSVTVGEDEEHPGVCHRCLGILKSVGG